MPNPCGQKYESPTYNFQVTVIDQYRLERVEIMQRIAEETGVSVEIIGKAGEEYITELGLRKNVSPGFARVSIQKKQTDSLQPFWKLYDSEVAKLEEAQSHRQ